jgi:hypothetical protein
MNHSTLSTDADLMQSLFAARVASALGEQANDVSHDIGERLRFAREQALERARAGCLPVSAATASPMGRSGVAAVLGGGGGSGWWVALASMLPLVVLAAGLVLIGHWTTRAQVLAAADVDVVLLTDDLPPSAYSDPGFAEFLKKSNQ